MTLKELLTDPETHFVLFGGKGGVGKTSSAAASAVWTAENTGKSILIVSTDPAHSLSDSFGVGLEPGVITEISDVRNLYALELSPSRMIDDVQQALNGIKDVGGSGPEIGGMNIPLIGNIMDFAEMSPPGMDEAMAFGKVLEFLENSDYDLVIFDTAPTGHTLRLLSLPEILTSWIGKIIMLQLKMEKFFKLMKGLFKKKKGDPDGALEMMKRLKSSIEMAKDELEDPRRTSFVIVMIAEEMAIYETERLLSSLITYNIPARHIIINQIYPEIPNCNFCKARHEFQIKHLKEIREIYEDEFDLIEVPLFDQEIRKFNQLRKMAKYLIGDQ
ncbi:MAG: ArsA family ATPase [Promethearchaeota archaeon]